LVILEWKEALVTITNIKYVGFWRKFKVVSIIDEKGDCVIFALVARSHQKPVNQTVLNFVEDFRENLNPTIFRNIDIGAERIQIGYLGRHVELILSTIGELWLVSNFKCINGKFPFSIIWSLDISKIIARCYFALVITSKEDV